MTLSASSAVPDASVVVVTHNNRSLIADCLKAVRDGMGSRTAEVIVVDNCSTDGTLSAIPPELKPTRLIAMESNVGFARATNAGIAASSGRFLVLVNSDAFPDPGSIGVLIQAIERLPRAAIVGARLRYPSGALQPSAGSFPSLLGGLWVALFLHRAPIAGRLGVGLSAHPSLYRTRRRVDWVTGAFCIARRDAGALPTHSFMYGEDVEWAWHSRRAGMEVWLEPAATAVHIGHASVRQSRGVGFAQLRRAAFELRWFERRGRLAKLAARGVLALHALLRLALYGAMGVARPRARAAVSEYVTLLRAALRRHGGGS